MNKRQVRQELALKEAVFYAPSIQQACANIAQLEYDKVLEILSERAVINFTDEGNEKQMIDYIHEELRRVRWDFADISNTCADTEYKGKMTYASRLQKRDKDTYIVTRWETEECGFECKWCFKREKRFNYDVRIFLVRFNKSERSKRRRHR